MPDGAHCELQGSHVQDTIKVERGATLIARGVRGIGNVQGENARHVSVNSRSRVGGSVQVKQGGSATVSTSTCGDIQYDENAAALKVSATEVGGNIVHGNKEDQCQAL